MRLGLLLSEIGQANGVEVSQQEMNMLVQQAGQQYRPEDRHFGCLQYLQENPMAAAQLRAPMFEDKVVDFLFEKATVTDKAVTKEALEAAIEAEPTPSQPRRKRHLPRRRRRKKKPLQRKPSQPLRKLLPRRKPKRHLLKRHRQRRHLPRSNFLVELKKGRRFGALFNLADRLAEVGV